MGSIDEAVQRLVSQEVDSLLRQSLDEQIAYLRKPLKVDIAPIETRLARLTEIDQRRNVYVHNRCVANRYYLKRVAASLVHEFDAEEGKLLPVDDEYLAAAIDTVYLSGVMLIMQSWTKWAKAEDEERELFLVNATYEELLDQRNELVRDLAEFAREHALRNDERRRMVAINHAIAMDQAGDRAGMVQVLDSLDWSATGLRFGLAICSLRGDEAEFFRLLPKAIAADEVSRAELDEWPVYANARSFSEFAATVNRLAPSVATSAT